MTGAAVVTGAGQGLGAALAQLLSDRGHVVVVTDVDLGRAEATAARIGGRALALALDVRDAAQTDQVRDRAVEVGGGLDVWVNNAGVLVTGPAWEQDAATRQLQVDVNVVGTMNGTVAAIEAMRERGGHIVNVVSLAGLVAVPGEAVYAGSKHAALGFSLSTAADLRVAGIRGIDVSCVCPDGIWTPMLHDKLDDPSAALSFSGTLLQTEDVVEAVRRVLDRPRAVTAVPAWRGVQARAVDAVPSLGAKVLPLAVKVGRWQQRKLARAGR